MTGLLISTIYENPDSTMLSVRDFSVQKILLLVDKNTKEKQLRTISMIRKTFGGTIEIAEKKVELYDVLAISRDLVKIIDSAPNDCKIYVDITQGRKPQALGLLLACYARPNRIQHIVYWNDENRATYMPKFSFNVDSEEKMILAKIGKLKMQSLMKSLGVSKATFYRLIKRLEGKELIKKDNDGKYSLTDAGRIALL